MDRTHDGLQKVISKGEENKPPVLSAVAQVNRAKAHRSQIEEERIHSVLPGFKSHFLPSRFLSGSRAWKFRERFGL
jgi:hypothetical protein